MARRKRRVRDRKRKEYREKRRKIEINCVIGMCGNTPKTNLIGSAKPDIRSVESRQ